MRRCKVCGDKYLPQFTSMQRTCNKVECMVADGKRKADLAWKKEKVLFKAKNKTRTQWLRELQQVFNTFIRRRDENKPCVSCGKRLIGKYDAGHYFSVGSYPNLRFEEDNVHGQCVECNQHKGGNLIEYGQRLIERIGRKKLDELMSKRNDRLSLSAEEIKEKINFYKSKIK